MAPPAAAPPAAVPPVAAPSEAIPPAAAAGSPAAGAVVAAAPEAEFVIVPNVVGMSKDDAQSAISGARLEMGNVTFQPHDTVPAGHVISQDPAAGARVRPGTPVNIVISTGAGTAGAGGMSLGDVYFDYDRSAIRSDATAVLESNATTLKSERNLKVLIEGHCDERGTSDYNLVLGEKRARAAKQYLQDLGVEASRVQITSLGKEKPSCMEHNTTCWQKNRRAHFVLQ
jgi:peptidoglycan-associated lipoprotein